MKNNGSPKMCTWVVILLGMIYIMAPVAAIEAGNQVNDVEEISSEVIQEIKDLLLNKIGIVSPPPPTDGKSLMTKQEAKAYSIKHWRRNTPVHPEQMEKVSSTLSAQIAFNGN